MIGADEMPKTSISFHVGKKTSLSHNNRENIHGNPDINPEKIKDNITYKCEDIRNVYEREFSEVVSEYNGKQKRKDRRIKCYYSKMLNNKKTNHQNEIIVQIGKHDDGIDWDIKKEILDKYAREFQAENPSLKVYNSVMHLDEKSPHLHINYIPVYESEKETGMRKIVSQNSVMESMSQTGAKKKHAFDEWASSQREKLTKMMSDHNLARVKKGSRKYYDVKEYKEMKKELKAVGNEIKKAEVELKNSKLELDKNKKVLKEIKSIGQIKPETTVSGAIKPESYKEMRNIAKGSLAIRDDYKKGFDARGNELESLKRENNKLKTEKSELRKDVVNLKMKNQDLERKVGRLEQFLQKLNLLDKFKEFSKLNPFKKRSMDNER